MYTPPREPCRTSTTKKFNAAAHSVSSVLLVNCFAFIAERSAFGKVEHTDAATDIRDHRVARTETGSPL